MGRSKTTFNMVEFFNNVIEKYKKMNSVFTSHGLPEQWEPRKVAIDELKRHFHSNGLQNCFSYNLRFWGEKAYNLNKYQSAVRRYYQMKLKSK